MVDSCRPVLDDALEVFIGKRFKRSAVKFVHNYKHVSFLEDLSLGQFQSEFHSGDEGLDVVRMLKVVRLDDRRVERIAGPELDEAAALWPQQSWKQETSVAESLNFRIF